MIHDARRWLSGAVIAAACLLPLGSAEAKEETAIVLRVIDGDTIEVTIADRVEKVRLIGVDTPETVDPRKPVEEYGKEASDFTRRLVEGKRVVLRDEVGGQDRDRYGRLLRYVYLEEGGTFVNAEIIKRGYGHAYVKYPFSHMDEFRALEREAREKGLGLWAGTEPEAEPGQARAPTESLSAPSATAAPEAEQIVYVTRTGAKYHRAGCRYLSKSMIPMELRDAALRYAPCSVCRPPLPPPERSGRD